MTGGKSSQPASRCGALSAPDAGRGVVPGGERPFACAFALAIDAMGGDQAPGYGCRWA